MLLHAQGSWASEVAARRLSSCDMWVSVVAAQELESTGSVVVRMGFSCSAHVGSSQSKDQTRIPCIAGRFLSTVSPGKSCNLLLSISQHYPCDIYPKLIHV